MMRAASLVLGVLGFSTVARAALAASATNTVSGDATSSWLEGQLPDWLSHVSVGLAYWQWLAILLVVVGGLLFDVAVRHLLQGVWRRYSMRRLQRQPDPKLVKQAVRPFGLTGQALVWYFGLTPLGLPPQVMLVVQMAVRLLLVVGSVWAAYRLTDLFSEFLMRRAEKTATKFDDVLVPLLRKSLKVFATAVGLVYMADAFRIQIVPLLTGLGIGGLAIAFAAKDSIENFFGSVTVILDRPFEIGDWVVIEGIEGTVEELGLRSTRIRTFYNSQVTVPNASLVRARVDNYGRRRYRRFMTHIDVTYDTPPDKIEAFCAGIRELILAHPYTRKDYLHVWLNEFGAASLRVLVYLFFETPDWATELRERHRFMLDVIRLAARLHVEFAFPTQTLHVYNEQHGLPVKTPPPPGKSAERDAVEEGRRAVRELTADASWRAGLPAPVRFGDLVTTEAGDEPPLPEPPPRSG